MADHINKHAIVIGGSMAGLMTARVLADHFAQVTVLERDEIEDGPKIHNSIPQGNHYHALLAGGQQVLASLFPGFIAKLRELGGVPYRIGEELAWYIPEKSYAATTMLSEPEYLGFDAHGQSRGLLEHCVRQFTLSMPHIRTLHTNVSNLIYENGRVRGVQCEREGVTDNIEADLVVDTAGRNSRVPRWLTDYGFKPPEETTLGVDFAYSSTKLRIPDSYDDPVKLHIFFGPAPRFPNGAIMGEIEDRTWHLSLAGRFGNYPPVAEDEFFAFARSIYHPRLYEIIKGAERVADIRHYRFPNSVQRHYERLTAFPDGLVTLGDAICSFNPVYGQGMSSAALQVKILQGLLAERAAGSQSLDGLALEFFPRAAAAVATPWALAAAQDLAYPQTTGVRPPDMAEQGQYFGRLSQLAGRDVAVRKLMAEVFHLVKPLPVLMAEPLRSRVLAQ